MKFPLILASGFVGSLCLGWSLPALAQRPKIIIDGKELNKATVVELDPLLDARKMWALTPDAAEKQFKDQGFKWLSDKKRDSAQIRRERWGFETRELKMFEKSQSVEEVTFEFKDGKLNQLVFAIWNKGDSEHDDLGEKEFLGIVGNWTKQLDTRINPKHEDKGKDTASAAKAERRFWSNKDMDCMAQLEFSGGKGKMIDPNTGRERPNNNIFQGEFIRLRFAQLPKTLVGFNSTTGGTPKMNRSDLVKHVKKEANGDILIPDVPMVDQGDKGYCAVATAARVLNYYGIPCDQHEMAQVTGASGGGGTDPKDLEDALHKMQGRYQVRIRHQLESFASYEDREYKNMMDNYNRVAKKMGKNPLDTKRFVYFMHGLDPEILREVRGKGQPYDKFMKVVKENISNGVPVLWGLQLGMYPENGEPAKQAGGGHMRLIIGFNDKNPEKPEIIFSDSWGAGHEVKRMAAHDASAATMGLYTVEPEF